jgi:hypothetical protein
MHVCRVYVLARSAVNPSWRPSPAAIAGAGRELCDDAMDGMDHTLSPWFASKSGQLADAVVIVDGPGAA